ncbi:hypothetical protein [Candidatus Korobacter versatilis]|uniref:hypothetical protein n=1 Tax=Candidatus Korobacter versatilis TaxID=658062 RepID=UPI000309C53B|nr:hypothetical protein [Candidatus Koribacter versatilis]
MAKEQSDSERDEKLAENRKASGDAARKQLGIPAKKRREDENHAGVKIVPKPTDEK